MISQSQSGAGRTPPHWDRRHPVAAPCREIGDEDVVAEMGSGSKSTAARPIRLVPWNAGSGDHWLPAARRVAGGRGSR
jgi:hypothetical protein